MMEAKRDLCLILLISSYIQYARPNALMMDYSSNTRSVVSKGTQAEFECSSSLLIDAALLRTGRIEWSRNTRYSTSTQAIARWSNDDGVEILLDDPDGRYTIEGGLTGERRFRQYLTIRQVQRMDQTDATGYYCALFNSSGSLVTKSAFAQLTVRYPPAVHYPLCTATPDDITQDVELMCISEKTTPDVTVQWYRDNVKVSDTHQSGYQTKSRYLAHSDELQSEFECRLYYRDRDDVEVRRSCKFSRPRVAILRMGGELQTGENTHHVFAISNLPLISDINCTLEASPATSQRFDVEFPGYGVVVVGPVAPVDNGSTLACQAKNVFGVGEARMVVYSRSDLSDGETTLPSVVTNYKSVDEVLQATIWPKELEVIPGENATFVCSYSLTVHSYFRTTVEVKWEHDDIITTDSQNMITTEENILYITNIQFEGFSEATISCVVSVSNDDPMLNSTPDVSSYAELKRGIERPCGPKLASSQNQLPQSNVTTYIVCIGVLAASVIILMITLPLVFALAGKQKKRKKYRSDSEHSSSSQVTYRADPSSGDERSNRVVSQATIQRALPAQPDEAAPTTTLRSVVTSPPSATLIISDIGKQRLESISSCNTTNTATTDLPYQEMVGDTGINKSRHGSVSSNINFHQRHAPLVRSLSIPASMIPVPTGGFLPAVAGGQLGIQRSTSDNTGEGDGEACYEDPDSVRERRRIHRSMSNDYQTTTGCSTKVPMTGWQQKELAYANSSLMDDSVFLVERVN